MARALASDTAGKAAVVATTASYLAFVEGLKQRIGESRTRALRAVNSELVMLYWSIGTEILEQQRISGWGDDIVGRIAQDLAADGGPAKGFSRRNLFYMRRFAALWPQQEKVQPLAAQLGWSHHQVLLDAFGEDRDRYAWYAERAAESHWSRRRLKRQIDLGPYERQGAALTNFESAIDPSDAQRLLEAVKDPYVFDFLDLGDDVRERRLEQALIDDIQRFLIELGAGFAFYGRQWSLIVGGQEFVLDLLFYHHALRRFVVVELKVGEFLPEYLGKMNFYLGAVDEQLRRGDDEESVGIILCTKHNETVAKLSLHRTQAPIAISTWRGSDAAPTVVSGVPSEQHPGVAQLDHLGARLVERVSRHAASLSGPE